LKPAYFWHILYSSPLSRRQLHHLCLQPLLRCIASRRLRGQERFVVCRHEWRHSWLWRVPSDIGKDANEELVVLVLDRGITGEEMVGSQTEFILIYLAYELQC
jgi:hypothetical protein